ncbi:MAG: S8 family serine peptidase [Bacteroidota bacterium]
MFSSATRVLLTFLLLGFQAIVFGQNSKYFNLPSQATENDYLNKTIILKVKPEFRANCTESTIDIPKLQQAFAFLNVSTIQKKFPTLKAPGKQRNELGQEYADLTLIYEINYGSNTKIETAINQILATNVLEYAQPHYLMKPLDYVPSDPLNFNQYHLALIKAYKAWDLYKGDTNTVIGICDWGTDIDHPDLINNIKYNNLDPIDGIDNDNDGYIDNYRGWDLGDNDNNPQGLITHGCFVSGLASAKTDNAIGLSGTGFLCKFLPVKVSDSSNQGTKTFEAIVYAVEHGCSIVNCSWGQTFFTGPFGQDVVNYATINKGALIVAACGNSNNLTPFYPASYEYVLSIAATNNLDTKWNGSSYGYFVDLSAPGENVWSTLDGGTYGGSSGTSFSAPIVSGCAALLKSKYPSLTGLQIGEKLKVSADIIDTSVANTTFKDLLGSGRLNIFRAFSDTVHPSIIFTNHTISDLDNDGTFTKNDTLIIKGNFINYLAPSTSNLKVTLTCLSHNAIMIDSVVHLGVINTLSSINNNSNPFSVFLKPSLGVNEELIFKLTFTDDNYRAVQCFYFVANINYLNIDTNRIATSINSQGMMGYNDGNCIQGLGFRYNESETLLYSGGFIVGKSYTQVSDALYGASGGFDHDFFALRNISKLASPTVADFEAANEFNDSLALATRMYLLVKQHAFVWASAPRDKFIILQYTIINKNNVAINNLYAGQYLDWDIGNSLKNRIGFDASNRLGYCFSIEGGPYTGVSLITPGPVIHYGFDNDGANGSIKVTGGFTSSEKYAALKTSRNDAGMLSTGNDVSQMLSSGPYTLSPYDSIVLAFAIMAGDHLNDLQNSVAQAIQGYYQTGIEDYYTPSQGNTVLFQNEPNPFSNNTSISFYLDKELNVELTYSSINGNTKEIIFSGKLGIGMHSFDISKNLSPGVYIYSLTTEKFSLKKKMCVIK